MILDKLVKAKWESRDPEVRKSAIDDMSDVQLIKELALNDEAAIVRQAAIRKVTDLSVLDTVIRREQEDDAVKETATQLFRQLVTGQKASNYDLDSRIQWTVKLDGDRLDAVATHGKEPELRLAAVGKIEREGLLGDIAINDEVRDVRLKAAEKLTQKSTLERVYKAARSKDKQVTRIAKDKLDAIVEAEERPAKVRAECDAICTKLSVFGRDNNTITSWEQEHAEYLRLKERWQAIAEYAEADCTERYTKAEQAFTSAYAEYEKQKAELEKREAELAPIRELKQQVCDKLEKIATDLEQRELIEDEESEKLSQTINEQQQQWQTGAAIDDAKEEQQWQTRYQKAFKSVTQQLKTLQSHYRVACKLEAICSEGDKLLSEDASLRGRHIKTLQERWSEIDFPKADLKFINDLKARFAELTQSIDAHRQEQDKQREQNVDTLKGYLQEAEKYLESGELHKAMPHENNARTLFAEIKGLSSKRYKALEKRVQAITTKIRELHNWEKWGDNLERERLCEEIEHLIENPDDNPEETARIIRDAQKTWKGLGTKGHSQALWERFNKACNEAYKPCKVYFEEQAQQRHQHFEQKQIICAELETFGEGIDWEQPDWKEIHHQVREFEKRWRNVGPTDRKQKKPLQTRFDAAMQPIDKRLDAERKSNLQFRERLTANVIKAHNIDDLSEAIEEVKKLQAQWHVTVPGSRKDERNLWKTFRKECDVVFDRRKQKQEERQQERQNHLNKKKEVCEQIEALGQLSGDELKSAKSKLRDLKSQWQAAGEVPKKALESIERRYHRALEQFDRQCQSEQASELHAQLEYLHQRAKLCAKLEHLAEASEEAVEAAKADWEAMPALLDKKVIKNITRRFDKACKMATTGKFNYSDEALAKRKELCIRIEILSGIDSPAEEAKARMAYQVARLSEAMQGGYSEPKNKVAEAQEIEQSFYLAGAVSAEQASQLNPRFLKARDAFYQVKDAAE
ncbi:DUF349 domain-containing protein [Candidatus Albibeggiatoa sp. nov. NOAA]|uniref:DUF349 domain-containing protein n=1 Tax=Candidatus Albibeggiatoa sp. nov. NOAA TaxID=3162724 RepID=UPI0032F58C72|nr:DUF349 domain-containing protein [Thiotrichaceae bacterium]